MVLISGAGSTCRAGSEFDAVRRALPAQGLYAITPDRAMPLASLIKAVSAALEGGAVLVQYRRKDESPALALEAVRALVATCERYGGLLIVNDDIALARQAGAHGVHLGRDDADFRPLLEDDSRRLLVGVSCYGSLPLAQEAARCGADYIAFGSVYPSPTKPRAPACPLEIFRTARRELSVPLVAIGGITPENAAPVIAAGAHFVAAISGVFEMPEIRQAARAYADLFNQAENPPHVRTFQKPV